MYRQPSRTANKDLNTWLSQHVTPELLVKIEEVPVRRDMLTLLTYVRDNKVVGTQSTGNMPLKAIREVTARFVKPPTLDFQIGDRTYRLRSEDDVRDLCFLHTLGSVGALLLTAPARRWLLTSHGTNFINAPPAMQLTFLLSVWWHKTNWLVAYPFMGMGEALPTGFNHTTLAHLRALPVSSAIAFEKFADELIAKTGLRWTSQDPTYHTMFLQGAVERMILGILETFGVLTLTYITKPLGGGTITDPDTFEITPLGSVLLEMLAFVEE